MVLVADLCVPVIFHSPKFGKERHAEKAQTVVDWLRHHRHSEQWKPRICGRSSGITSKPGATPSLKFWICGDEYLTIVTVVVSHYNFGIPTRCCKGSSSARQRGHVGKKEAWGSSGSPPFWKINHRRTTDMDGDTPAFYRKAEFKRVGSAHWRKGIQVPFIKQFPHERN